MSSPAAERAARGEGDGGASDDDGVSDDDSTWSNSSDSGWSSSTDISGIHFNDPDRTGGGGGYVPQWATTGRGEFVSPKGGGRSRRGSTCSVSTTVSTTPSLIRLGGGGGGLRLRGDPGWGGDGNVRESHGAEARASRGSFASASRGERDGVLWSVSLTVSTVLTSPVTDMSRCGLKRRTLPNRGSLLRNPRSSLSCKVETADSKSSSCAQCLR